MDQMQATATDHKVPPLAMLAAKAVLRYGLNLDNVLELLKFARTVSASKVRPLRVAQPSSAHPPPNKMLIFWTHITFNPLCHAAQYPTESPNRG